MLNKKAQVEDNLEIILSIILLIIGVVALTLVSADYKLSTDRAKAALQGQTTLATYDAEFMGTDLINILKMPANESISYGELFAQFPEFPYDIPEEYYNTWFSKTNLCSQDVFNKLDAVLTPIYGEYWRIHEEYQAATIYDCYRTEPYLSIRAQTNMTIPTTTPGQNAFVSLEVYQ